MDPRSFDDLARSVAAARQPATRRRLLAAIPAFAALAAGSRAVRAFDAAVPPQPGGGLCVSSADCPAGQVCLSGGCVPGGVGGARLDAGPLPTPVGGPTGVTPTPRSIIAPGETPETALPGSPEAGATATSTPTAGATTTPEAGATATPAASPTPANGVGGPTEPENAPIPAGIYAGRCGELGAEAAFPLIDVGSGEEPAADQPADAPAEPADFSATVVNAKLDDLLATPHAIDLRTDPKDPATSIACGDIAGAVDDSGEKREIPVSLAETNDSGTSGLAWIRDEGERSLAYVYADRPEAGSVEAAQAAGPKEGDTVTALNDLNLRAEPSLDAPVVQVLPAGTPLTVTGEPTDGWVPVEEPATATRGFVAEEFVEAAAE